MTVKIQGIPFELSRPLPFAEGHVLTQSEANALNQTWIEGIRNNFAGQIKKHLKNEGSDTYREPTDEDLQKFHSDFAAYASDYVFSERQTRAPVDPVEAEARRMARDTIVKALKTKGVAVKDVPSGKIESLIDGMLEKHEHIRKEAKRRIESARKVQGIELGDILDEVGSAPAHVGEA